MMVSDYSRVNRRWTWLLSFLVSFVLVFSAHARVSLGSDIAFKQQKEDTLILAVSNDDQDEVEKPELADDENDDGRDDVEDRDDDRDDDRDEIEKPEIEKPEIEKPEIEKPEIEN